MSNIFAQYSLPIKSIDIFYEVRDLYSPELSFEEFSFLLVMLHSVLETWGES